MVLVAVDEHFDTASYGAGFLHVLRKFLPEVRARVAENARIIRIVGQAFGTNTSLRNKPDESGVLVRAIADQDQRDCARRVEIGQKTADRVGIEGYLADKNARLR